MIAPGTAPGNVFRSAAATFSNQSRNGRLRLAAPRKEKLGEAFHCLRIPFASDSEADAEVVRDIPAIAGG
jgi:hypothetical protein